MPNVFQAIRIGCLAVLLSAGRCLASTFTILHTGDPAIEGYDTTGLAALDGNLYIANANGPGANRYFGGTLLQLNIASGKLTVLHDFSGKQDGQVPVGLVVGGDRVYGETREGGTGSKGRGDGTLFKVFPELGVIATPLSFPPSGLISPQAYAPAYVGGALYAIPSGRGKLIYKYDLATKSATRLPVLGGSEYTPDRGLVRSGSFLYGIARGGPPPGPSTVLYRLDPATQQQTVIHVFTGENSDQKFVLKTSNGGNLLFGVRLRNPNFYDWQLVEFDIQSGVSKILYTFGDDNPSEVPATLVWAPSHLYGSTLGGRHKSSTLFQIDLSSGVESTVHTFDFGSVKPQTLLIENGTLFGTIENVAYSFAP